MSGYVAELRGAIEEFTPLLQQMSDSFAASYAERLVSSPNQR